MTEEMRKYVGSRYVPIFGRKDEESIAWDNSASYEPLTVVLYGDDSYTSRQFVPIGIEITNEDYWAKTGNYNAHIENIEQALPISSFSANDTVADALIDLGNLLPYSAFGSSNTVKDNIDALDSRLDDIEDFIPETVIGFDTVADMKASTILENGMICHTNGFHSSGDGGAAYYEISDIGTANEMDIIACGSLYANLVITEPFVTPEQFGAYGDGEHDDLGVLEYIISKNIPVIGDNIYKTSDSISFTNGNDSSYNNDRIAYKFKVKGIKCNKIDTPAIIITNAFNDIDIDYIESEIGIKLHSNSFMCYNNNFHSKLIKADDIGILLQADANGVQENNIVCDVIKTNGIGVKLYSNGYWVTENHFEVHRISKISGNDNPKAIYSELVTISNGEINTNDFNNLSLEGTTGIELKNSMAEFYKLRVTEVRDIQWLKLVGSSGIYAQTNEVVVFDFADCSELDDYQFYPCVIDCEKASIEPRGNVQRVSALQNCDKSTLGFAAVPSRRGTMKYVNGNSAYLCTHESYTTVKEIVQVFQVNGQYNIMLSKQHYNCQGISEIIVYVPSSGVNLPYSVLYDDNTEAVSLPSAGTWIIRFYKGYTNKVKF